MVGFVVTILFVGDVDGVQDADVVVVTGALIAEEIDILLLV